MSLNISQKISLGFLTLVFFILVVGAGGLIGNQAIYQNLNQVTQRTLPILEGSFNQMIALQDANQSLLSALIEQQAETIEQNEQVFTQQIEQFNGYLEQLTPAISQYPALRSALSDIQQTSQNYTELAQRVMQQHSQTLALSQQIKKQEARFQKDMDATVAWLQRYVRKTDNIDGKISAKSLQSNLNSHLFQITNYQRSGDSQKLLRNLDNMKGLLESKLNRFKAAETKATQVAPLVQIAQKHFFQPEGLVAFYMQRETIQQQLAQLQQDTHQKLNQVQDSAELFITKAQSLAQQAQSDAEQSNQFSQKMIITLSAGSVIFALLVAIITINTLRRPLASFSQLLTRVSQGELNLHFEQDRKDEFGQLAESLNAVVDNLKDVLKQVAKGAEHLSEVAQQNAGNSLQASQSMAQQSQQLEMTAATAEELQSSVSEVSGHSQHTLTTVQACEDLNQQVNQNVDQTLTSIRSQAQAITQAVKDSEELSSYSNQIDTILETIHSVAEQTNLLALNAAIEAARAGDHGRGFAVVADEVRELASRTSHSIQDIQQMVDNMQASIQQVVTMMQDSYNKAEACVAHAEASQDSLLEMTEAITNIRQMNQQIAHACENQDIAVAEVSKTLVQIKTSASETAEGAIQSEQRSQQLLSFTKDQQTLLKRFSVD